jgi:magnesium transporter
LLPTNWRTFARRFEFDPVFLTDSLDLDERARYERDEDMRFILINTPIKNKNARNGKRGLFHHRPIGVVLTIEHVVTISAIETPVLEKFLENNVRNFNPADEKRFVLQMLEQNVYYFLVLPQNPQPAPQPHRKRTDAQQPQCRAEATCFPSKKVLVYFVNSLNANELLKMKMKRTDFLHINGDEDLTDLFEDIIIDNSQALSMANVYTNILNGTMDAYSSIISNNLNQVIHRLTIITVVLMVPTLISSFFGMNIPNGVPEHPWAFYATIVAAGIITGGLYWVMKRRKML